MNLQHLIDLRPYGILTRARPLLVCSLCSAMACNLYSAQRIDEILDPDGDGAMWPYDCDDTDPLVDDSTSTWYLDQDGDGFGDPDPLMTVEQQCHPPQGYVSNDLDCDDSDPDVNPGLLEEDFECDAKDNDCNGEKDDGLACRLLGVRHLDSDADFKLTGTTANERAGYVVASVGDVLENAYPDFLVAAPSRASGSLDSVGAVYLVDGLRLLNLWESNGDFGADGQLEQMADIYMEGNREGEHLGYSMLGGNGGSTAVDYNGDGIADLVLGAPFLGEPDSFGEAHVYLGGQELDTSAPHATLQGLEEGDLAGCSLASPGDLDSDGRDEILVGAMDWGALDQGIVAVFAGSSTGAATPEPVALYHGATDGESAGSAISQAGDISGSGQPYVLVGASAAIVDGERRGLAYILPMQASWHLGQLEPVELELADEATPLTGEADGDEAGFSVCIVGDANADGYQDMLVGAPEADGTGSNGGIDQGNVYLVLGSTIFDSNVLERSLADAETIFEGTAEGELAGSSLSTVGDVDGDGADDFVIGAKANGTANVSFRDEGYVYLLYDVQSGTVPLSEAPLMVVGEQKDDQVGASLSHLGTLPWIQQQEALTFLIMGAPGEDSAGTDAGAAYIFGIGGD